MNKTNISSTLAAYISTTILKQPELTLSQDEALISSGLIDSFHLVDLALYVEETFNVHLDDTELNANTFDTIDQLADLVIQRTA